MQKNQLGMVYVFCGKGKGKTSAALGTTIRMILKGHSVVWISWFKEEAWKISEMNLSKIFKEKLKMYWTGNGFFGGPMDHDTPLGHKRAAESALSLAKNVLEGKEGNGGIVPDLLVLDEVIRAVNDGLLKIDDVLKLVKMRGSTHLVLTGHDCPKELIEVSDLVTEMKKIKHPYDKGVLAISGLDF